MKRDLLVICAKLPCPPYDGLTVRYAHFLQGLSERWRLWVVAFADPQRREQGIAVMQPFCHRLEVLDQPPEWSKWRRYLSLITHRAPYHNVLPRYTLAFRERLRSLLQSVRPDAALFLYIPMADYRYELPSEVPKVMDHPDAFSPHLWQLAHQTKGLHRRLFALMDTWKFQAFQRRAAAEFDLNIVVTDEDRKLLSALSPSAPIAVLPTGIDTDEFAPNVANSLPEEADLIMTGVFTYAPNIDAAHFLCEEIMPYVWRKRSHTTVMFVGRQFSDSVRALASERVRLFENVPDIRPYYEAAKIFVAPYRFVFGIRYKILEAMAMGKALVGTSEAFTGIPVQHGVHALVCDTPEEFAEAVLTLLTDGALRKALGMAAREFVCEHFDRRKIVARLNALLEGIGR